MDNQKEKLIKILKLWLRKNSLDTDTRFYTIEEWKQRGEEYHNDADFVVVTEGDLHFMLNYGDSDEFYDLVDSFGYICELGHSWNMGFYYDEEHVKIGKPKSYSELLKDRRWIEKRNYIRARAENKCEDCGSTNKLEIHHCYYQYGFEPWEYPFDALRCLCESCHKKRGFIEMELRGHLAALKFEHLESLIKLIDTGLYWYPEDQVFPFLKAFQYDQAEMQERFTKILASKRSNNQ